MKRRIAAVCGVLLLWLMLTAPRQFSAADAALQTETTLDGVTIYFSESSGEALRVERGNGGISRFAGLLRSAGAALNTLDWRLPFPPDMDMLILPGATADYGGDQIARLWAYLENGGRVLLLVNPSIPQGRGRAFGSNNPLFVLTNADYGILPLDDVMVIEETRTTAQSDVRFLRAGFLTDDINTDHPVTAGVNGSLIFFQARSLRVNAPDDGVLTPLIYAPEQAYGETSFPQYQQDGTFNFDIGADTAPGRNVLALAYQDNASGGRMVVIGDREFAANGWGFNASPPTSTGFLYPAQVQLMLNAVAWLTETSAPVFTFPTPGPTATPTITPSPVPPTATPTAGGG